MQNFFSMGENSSTVVSHFKNEHKFTVDQVIQEFRERTDLSRNADDESYNQYEINNIQLS